MAKTNAPTLEEAAAIEKVLRYRNETYADAWALNLNLALRISDLLALTYKDVAGTGDPHHRGQDEKSSGYPELTKRRVRLSTAAVRHIPRIYSCFSPDQTG